MVPAAPPVQATAVVAAPIGTAAPDDLAATVADLLAAAGWQVEGTPPGVQVPTPVPTPDGASPDLPGGVLEAVLLRWEGVR